MYETLSELGGFMLEARVELTQAVAMICALTALGGSLASLVGLVCLVLKERRAYPPRPRHTVTEINRKMLRYRGAEF